MTGLNGVTFLDRTRITTDGPPGTPPQAPAYQECREVVTLGEWTERSVPTVPTHQKSAGEWTSAKISEVREVFIHGRDWWDKKRDWSISFGRFLRPTYTWHTVTSNLTCENYCLNNFSWIWEDRFFTTLILIHPDKHEEIFRNNFPYLGFKYFQSVLTYTLLILLYCYGR